MISRTTYLNKLSLWKDQNVIKVITGIRRCGKSTLLKMFQDRLVQNGVERDQIISLNLEDLANESLLDHQKLYQYIIERLSHNKTTYMLD